jgi:uncharacterized protein YkwD
MEGSTIRSFKMIRKALPALLLVGVVAVAGCGGGGGDKSASAPAPVNKTASTPGGVVSADGTLGLVGPVGRATAKKQQFSDQTGKIPANANRKTNAQKHGVIGPGDCPNGDVMPADDNVAQLNATILCLVNGERAVQSLPALGENSELDQSANGMCQRMITEHFFSHDTPDGKTIVDRVQPTGYIPNSGDWVVGENLAWGSGALSTPQAIVNGWMNSPGHKANILAPDYKDIGLAACNGTPTTTNSGGTVYVNNFGAKSGADPNIVLPGHNDTSGSGTGTNAAAATVAGTKATAAKRAKARRVRARRAKAKRRATCVRRASRIKSKSKRHARIIRCRRRK